MGAMECCCRERRAKVSLVADALLEGMLEVRKLSGASSFGEVVVLLAVAAELRSDNLPTVASVSELTSISTFTVQRSLDKFVAAGLLERGLTPRGYVYELTELVLGGGGDASADCDLDACINQLVEKMGMAITKMAKL
ncbi:hypothetical protein SAMN04515695_4797 [Pseudovibrio sp. Tun.PSC04-5.I4]|nr:hypothetical protein SAMN04515695_2821 [Pseudovibrio sp. Tun.PSC04-5.I4]SDR34944.1 hypothetical protein SAMN04515695_4797 [Pseudovibrio sp. Tun.PSC04-5.I4]